VVHQCFVTASLLIYKSVLFFIKTSCGFSQLKQLKQLLTIGFVVFLIIMKKPQRRRVFIGMNVAHLSLMSAI
jgi:hypothetical protein